MNLDLGYEILPHSEWPVFHDLARRSYGLKEAWPPELACHHLRWLAGERHLGNLTDKNFPTSRALAQEWNWPAWKAADLVTDLPRWMDPYKPVTLLFLWGAWRMRGAAKKRNTADVKPTPVRREADVDPTSPTDERQQSEQKADVKPTPVRREADASPTLRAFSPRASTDHRSPITEEGEIAPPPAAAPPTHPPAVRKPKKSPTTGYHEAVALWTKLYADAFGRRYVWQFEGRDADGARVKSWLAAAEVVASDPAPGLARLEGAIRAYVAAEAAGKVFPFEDLPDTRRFSKALPQWFGRAAGGVRPRAPPGPNGRPTNGHGKPSPLETFLSWSQPEDGHGTDDSACDGDPPGGAGWESADLGHRTAGDRRRVVDVPG